MNNLCCKVQSVIAISYKPLSDFSILWKAFECFPNSNFYIKLKAKAKFKDVLIYQFSMKHIKNVTWEIYKQKITEISFYNTAIFLLKILLKLPINPAT